MLTFTKALHELPRRNQHDIIQNVAKEKKQQKIVTGLEEQNRMTQGNELYQLLYEKTSEKFNPMNLKEKVIQSEGV